MIPYPMNRLLTLYILHSITFDKRTSYNIFWGINFFYIGTMVNMLPEGEDYSLICTI